MLLIFLFAACARADVPLNINKASQAVVLLYRAIDNTRGVEGTGFIVSVNNNLYLITAEHVAKDMDESADVIFGDTSDAAIKIKLTLFVRTKIPYKLAWITHGTADVAVIAISPPEDVAKRFRSVAFLPKHFFTHLEAPPRDRPLTTIGYPLGLGGMYLGEDKRISPLSRESKAASGLITLPRADNHVPVPTFLLDSPSIGGFSGAPVLMLPQINAVMTIGGDGVCVGLVHGTWSDETGGKLAAVVPVAYIAETLNKAFSIQSAMDNNHLQSP